MVVINSFKKVINGFMAVIKQFKAVITINMHIKKRAV